MRRPGRKALSIGFYVKVLAQLSDVRPFWSTKGHFNCQKSIHRAKLASARSLRGSGWEISMQRLSRVLLGSIAAVALASGAVMFSTTEASAQLDIGGIIQGAMAHGYYGGYRHRGRVRETKRERHPREAKEEDKDKQDKSDKHEDRQVDRAAEGNSGNSNRAEDKGPPQSSPPPANSSTPKQPVADIPVFSPSR
jgi:hypothetical protein